MHPHAFFFSFRSARSASLPGSLNRTRRVRIHAPEGCMYCTDAPKVHPHGSVCFFSWRTLRSHDFDTITCVRRCERAVIFFFFFFFFRSALSARSFFVTSLRFGRYASGACVREFFFEAHSPLRSAARETTLRVGSASLPKIMFYRKFFEFPLFGNTGCSQGAKSCPHLNLKPFALKL